jgi:hypothetical protein
MKNDLPYFSHDNNASQHPKMRALIAEYGFEGYGRFWALNEMIARNAGACIDISRKVYKLNLANELRFDECGLDNFLKFISDPEIDLINIENGLITTDRINELYSKIMGSREAERDRIKEKREQKTEGENVGANNSLVGTESEDLQPNKDTDKIRSDKSKVKKSKCISDSDESQTPKRFEILDREPKNDMERVNKKWLENYIAIHNSQPINPSWNITAPLVSKAIKQAGIEKVLQALDTALKDEFCLKSGYMLKIILSGNVISRLINKPSGAGPPGKLEGKKSLGGLEL